MSDENKKNIQFFEASSMRELYDHLRTWQDVNNKRFLSISIHSENEAFCCIALTNPTEVVITDSHGNYVGITKGSLDVFDNAFHNY
jgi:hypothetical protein